MIKAVIFDMDGLLIDSEPLWEEAEIKTFTAVGVPLTFEMTKETMGLRVDEVVEHWYMRYPGISVPRKEVEQTVIDEVVRLVGAKGRAKEGVKRILQELKAREMMMGVASSSHMAIIKAVLEKLAITDYFKVIYSAEYEEYGKPHPAVFLTTANKLGVAPSECLVFEDSPNGVLAAKAAKMLCVAVPDRKMIGDKRFGIADAVITTLGEFDFGELLKY